MQPEYVSNNLDQKFNEIFSNFGKQVYEKFRPAIKNYQKYIIPFQIKRLSNQQAVFRSSYLEHEKFDLLHKVDQLTAQNNRHEYIVDKQTKKVEQMQIKVQESNNKNIDTLNQIDKLKGESNELGESIDEKVNMMKIVEEDKNQVRKDYESRNKDLDSLQQNYKRQKKASADKITYINQLQSTLLEKEKKVQQHEFYIKKQWQKLEQAKKQLDTQIQQPVNQFFLRRASSKKNVQDIHQEIQQNNKNKYQRQEILKNPIKKLFKHHNNEIYDLSFNYNGNIIATCGGDRTIKLYDVLNFKQGITVQSQSAESIFLSVSLDYSGDKLLAGSTDRSVQIYSTSTGKQLHSFVGHGYRVNSVSWSSAKEKCVSGSQDKQIKIWEIEKASNILSIPCGKPVKFLSCNSIQPVIYSGHSDGSVRMYSMTQSNSPIAHIKTPNQYPINSISVLSNRSQILISTQEGSPIWIMDLKMNKIVHKYEAKQFSNTIVRAQLSPSQKYIVGGNSDGSIYYWNKDTQSVQKRINCENGHQKTVTSIKYHFISGLLVSCDKQGNVIVWQ